MRRHQVRTGVAGAGVFGGYHAAKLAERGALAAVYDRDGARALDLADRHGAEGYDDLAAFFATVDAVVVALPASRHAEAAMAALQAGRHVLVEKPIALTLRDADALCEAASSRALVLQVGHQERYVADALGLLGRDRPGLFGAERLTLPSGRGGDVSVVLDLMIHDLDLLACLTRTHDAVVTLCEASGPRRAADQVSVELALAGTSARLSASRRAEAPSRTLRLGYPEGEVAVDLLTRDVTNETNTPLGTTSKGASGDAPLALTDPLAYGTERFLSAVAGEGPQGVTGDEGRAALALALTVEEAVREVLS